MMLAIHSPVHLREVRVGGDDGKLRPWHYIHVYSIDFKEPKPFSPRELGQTGAGLISEFVSKDSFRSLRFFKLPQYAELSL